MIGTRCLKNVVIFIQTYFFCYVATLSISSFIVPFRKILVNNSVFQKFNFIESLQYLEICFGSANVCHSLCQDQIACVLQHAYQLILLRESLVTSYLLKECANQSESIFCLARRNSSPKKFLKGKSLQRVVLIIAYFYVAPVLYNKITCLQAIKRCPSITVTVILLTSLINSILQG